MMLSLWHLYVGRLLACSYDRCSSGIPIEFNGFRSTDTRLGLLQWVSVLFLWDNSLSIWIATLYVMPAGEVTKATMKSGDVIVRKFYFPLNFEKRGLIFLSSGKELTNLELFY